jgi:hypothetical protein
MTDERQETCVLQLEVEELETIVAPNIVWST